MAAFMALTFATTSLAFRFDESPSSASAMARADAVKFSIWELAADSDLRSTAAKGAISPPIEESKRAISVEASSARAVTSDGNHGVRSATCGGMAAA
jgi:hypothetical protein